MSLIPDQFNIKHTLHYQEARRTVFLHAMNKDNLGRHRGSVLYGMELSPYLGDATGRSLQVGPGAVYTPYGTKMFLDTIIPGLMSVSLANLSVDGLNIFTGGYAALNLRPIVVAIICNVNVYQNEGSDDSANPVPVAQTIETDSALQNTDLISFYARVVSWNRDTVQPAMNLLPQSPIFMTLGEQLNGSSGQDIYNYIDTVGSATQYDTNPTTEALQFGEVLLGYVIIGFPSQSTANTLTSGSSFTTTDYLTTQTPHLDGYPTVPQNYVPAKLNLLSNTTQWAPGVSVVQIRNSWEQIEEMLGMDVLNGGNSLAVHGSGASGVTAVSQTPGQFQLGTTPGLTSPMTLSPQFGTAAVSGGAYQSSYSSYRLPSFMRDGDSVLWVLRRLDYMLRLWMDRTGDQTLVTQIQDGGSLSDILMPPLLSILGSFDGSTSLTTNLNTVDYTVSNAVYATATSDLVNAVLKSGVIAHTDVQNPNINAVLATAYGDTHLGAIKALEIAIYNILTNLLGTSAKQSWLRNTAHSGDVSPTAMAMPNVASITSVGGTLAITAHANVSGNVRAGGANNAINGTGNSTNVGSVTGDNLLVGAGDPRSNHSGAGTNSPVATIYQRTDPDISNDVIYTRIASGSNATGWKPLNVSVGIQIVTSLSLATNRYGNATRNNSVLIYPNSTNPNSLPPSVVTITPGIWTFKGCLGIGAIADPAKSIYAGIIWGAAPGGNDIDGVTVGNAGQSANYTISYIYTKTTDGAFVGYSASGSAIAGNAGFSGIPLYGVSSGTVANGLFLCEGSIYYGSTGLSTLAWWWGVYDEDASKVTSVTGGYLTATRIG